MSKQATINASTYTTINIDNLLRNYRSFAASDLAIAPVVKANAYGHGAVDIARLLIDEADIPFLIVASYAGVKQLREADIAAPILVIGHVPSAVIAANSYSEVTFTAVGLEHLTAIASQVEKPQQIHLKLNTGMNRYGIQLENLGTAIEIIQATDELTLTGAFSHLSDDFDDLNNFTTKQIDRFNAAVQTLKDALPSCQCTHLASTASHEFRDHIEANTERIGIGLYGLANFTDEFTTHPVLSLMSHIASIRTVPAGEPVGYSRTYTTDKKRVIATVPAGYYEGVDRRLSNQGQVRVGDDLCPIVGKVSMNATTIDVTDCDPLPVAGNTVELISTNPEDPHSVGSIAKLIGAPTYRIPMQIPARLPRVLV